MEKLKCVICGATEDEVDQMIGVEYNPEDHGDKKDKALCDECITQCYTILKEIKFNKKVQEEVLKVLKTNEQTTKTI